MLKRRFHILRKCSNRAKQAVVIKGLFGENSSEKGWFFGKSRAIIGRKTPQIRIHTAAFLPFVQQVGSHILVKPFYFLFVKATE